MCVAGKEKKKRDPIEVKAGKVTTDSKSIDHVQYWTALTVFRCTTKKVELTKIGRSFYRRQPHCFCFCFCTSVELGSGGFLTINGLDDIITDHSDGASTLAELLGNMLAHVGSQTLEQI